MSRTHPPAPAPPMTFGAAVGRVFRRYADFSGRAGLPEFWWFVLLLAVVATGLGALAGFLPNSRGIADGLATFWSLATLLPTLAVAVRRLRDGGNRWTQLLWLFVPVAGPIVLILRFCDPRIPGDIDSTD